MALLSFRPVAGRTRRANVHWRGVLKLIQFIEGIGGLRCSTLGAIADFGSLRQRRGFLLLRAARTTPPGKPPTTNRPPPRPKKMAAAKRAHLTTPRKKTP